MLLTLKLSAMPPARSIAAEPIQRKSASGAQVPCWKTLRLLAASGRSSYQRTPVLAPAVTEWFSTSAWWSPKFR
ncbi:MAG: hypothetical protein NVSMB23_15280 [Myxococcales bacterium]